MASAFIIRPFGTQNKINFDRVENDLIDPALREFKIVGRTTGDSLKQGNIRTEMFQRLLTADIVIVDISIKNANVFYELGIRHALRNKRTFMIRCSGDHLPPDDVPFDIRTDRYFSYDPENPGSALEKLKEGLRQTILSEDKDSPVFQLLPDLIEQDQSRFLVVPRDFQEEVARAVGQEKPRNQWGDLKLLQTEVLGSQWEVEGLKVVGRAQFRKKAYEDARDTWEAVLKNDPDNQEANTLLGTLYQRMGNLTESNIALQRVLDNKATTREKRAEAHALMGRNFKEQWKASWVKLSPAQRQAGALQSPFLEKAYNAYRNGFIEDLSHYYSGINALALLTVRTESATALPGVWREHFENDSEAKSQLKKDKRELEKLRCSVTLSLEAAKAHIDRTDKVDMWHSITLADLACLTSKSPAFVADQYRRALAGAHDFEIDSVRRQLIIYEQLGVLTANVEEVLRAIPRPNLHEEKSDHVLLFTGHRMDSPGREKARFPPNKESLARDAIRNAIENELANNDKMIGIAGAASGGDILFHEICAELKIPSTLYLAISRDEYIRESVQSAGPQWVDRFNRLYNRLPRRELSRTKDLPRWLQTKSDYNIWQRNNLWCLYNAIACGGQFATLIALWDGGTGDGPGGTQDMVNRAEEKGAKTIILNTKELFGL